MRKTIVTATDKLHSEIAIKLACLDICKNGFNVKDYVNTKAKASIEKPEHKSSKQKQEGAEQIPTENQALADRLKAWRTEKFNSLNIPAYVILPQKALVELVKQIGRASCRERV